MSLKFDGVEQQQLGNAMKTNTGRQIGQALKSQSIDTAKNIATDVLLGNNLKEGLNREVNNIRARAADGIQQLNAVHNPYVAEDDSELESTKQNHKQKVKSIEEDRSIRREPTKKKRKQKQKVKGKQSDKFVYVNNKKK